MIMKNYFQEKDNDRSNINKRKNLKINCSMNKKLIKIKFKDNIIPIQKKETFYKKNKNNRKRRQKKLKKVKKNNRIICNNHKIIYKINH